MEDDAGVERQLRTATIVRIPGAADLATGTS
jgi:hypothetical protein